MSEPLDNWDRGLHYGDGLFETIAVRDGQPEYLEAHLQRLQHGCARLGIPLTDLAGIRSEIARAATAGHPGTSAGSAGDRFVIKLILTRGVGGRGYRPPEGATPSRRILTAAWPEWPAEWGRDGVRVRICTTRLGRNPALAGMKTLNRLEQVLARAEWDDADIAEGLMLDEDDFVIEATAANVFAVVGQQLLTPPLDRCGVCGIMRDKVLRSAATAGFQVETRAMRVAGLQAADQVLLSNSLIGLWPVREIAGAGIRVGDAGQRLMAAIAAHEDGLGDA